MKWVHVKCTYISNVLCEINYWSIPLYQTFYVKWVYMMQSVIGCRSPADRRWHPKYQKNNVIIQPVPYWLGRMSAAEERRGCGNYIYLLIDIMSKITDLFCPLIRRSGYNRQKLWKREFLHCFLRERSNFFVKIPLINMHLFCVNS